MERIDLVGYFDEIYGYKDILSEDKTFDMKSGKSKYFDLFHKKNDIYINIVHINSWRQHN